MIVDDGIGIAISVNWKKYPKLAQPSAASLFIIFLHKLIPADKFIIRLCNKTVHQA